MYGPPRPEVETAWMTVLWEPQLTRPQLEPFGPAISVTYRWWCPVALSRSTLPPHDVTFGRPLSGIPQTPAADREGAGRRSSSAHVSPFQPWLQTQ